VSRRSVAALRPSPQQELLVRTVFAPEHVAQGAWVTLRSSFELNRLEEGSYALMPLLERRLSGWNMDQGLVTRLRGIYRHNWYRGNVLLERLKEVLALAAGDVLLTGEPRLLLRSYRDAGLRPATRVDLLVRAELRGRLAAAVERAGWSLAPSGARTIWLERVDGPTVALHGRLAPQRDDEPWRHTVTVELDGGPQPATSATDELLRICAGEERRFPWQRLQWVADADALLRAEGDEVDWRRLVATAASSRTTLCLRDALRDLRAHTDAQIPDETLEQLERARAGARERLLYRLDR